jgi:hypothetical protein
MFTLFHITDPRVPKLTGPVYLGRVGYCYWLEVLNRKLESYDGWGGAMDAWWPRMGVFKEED